MVLEVSEVHHFTSVTPGQADLFGDLSVQLIASHGPRLFFRARVLAAAQERVVCRQSALVITLDRRPAGAVSSHLPHSFLPLLHVLAFEPPHFIAALIPHAVVA
ncbi:hypothetical protein NX905_29950, partial [Burkholderia thailandensis]|nr:hypothetical protein [Burkholderia thailandensis]